MKVFYFFSNWKWTGPAEPAVDLARGLSEREEVDLSFFPGSPTWGDPSLVEEKAREKGLESRSELYLRKHSNPYYNLYDLGALTRLLRREKPHIIHTNLLNGHFTAHFARWGKDRPLVIRSSYDGQPLSHEKLRTPYLLRRGTDALIVIGDSIREATIEKYPFLKGKVYTQRVGVDLERFDADRELPDFRSRLGIPAGRVVVGMVARMQPHRKFDLFLEAIDNLRQSLPPFEVVIVGRGTHAEEVAKKPARQMGLDDIIHFPGYLEGDEFLSAVKSFDIKVLMVPGSDGSCRAVREAMALGKPLAVGNKGVLPELIEESRGGVCFDYHLSSLTENLGRLIEDEEFRQFCAQKALKFAREHFQIEKRVDAVLEVYRQLLGQDQSQ